MYTVIGSPSTRAFRVLWMLEELEQPYSLSPAAPQSDAARAANPSGKVPILEDGDQRITDSTAILTYLADKHGALTFPAGTPERALQDSFTQQILDEIETALWTATRHSAILPQERRVPELQDTLVWDYGNGLNNIMARKSGPYLTGAQMTVPDIVLTHCASWAKFLGFPTDHAELGAYIKTTRARPAFQKLTAKP